MPTSTMIYIHIYFALNVFIGSDLGVHRMILEMIKTALFIYDRLHLHLFQTLHFRGKSVALKIVILTFCYVYELIITHTSSFASLTYQFLMSSLENQRKVPKNLLNFGVALSLYLACGPAPNVHYSCVPERTFYVLWVRTPVKIKKAQVNSKNLTFSKFQKPLERILRWQNRSFEVHVSLTLWS